MTLVGVDGGARLGAGAREWRERVRPVLGLLVIGLWLVWAVLAWRVEPRSVDTDQLRADIASGQIQTYRVTGTQHSERVWPPSATGDSWDLLALDETTGLPKDNQEPATGILYWVDASSAQRRHLDVDSSSVPWQNLVGELRTARVPLEAPPRYQPLHDDIAFLPGWAAIVLGLGSVLLVYRPTRVTRWGWLWLTTMVPFGFGLLALAVGELIRPSRRVLAPEPGRPTERRLRGGRAFLLALVVGILINVVTGELSRSVDALWMP